MQPDTSASPPLLAPWRLKLVRCIFGVVGLGLGIVLVCAGFYHQRAKHEKVAAWVKTPCRILTWSVDISRSAFGDRVQPTMTYQYDFDGKTHTSSNYDEATDWIVDLRDFEEEGDAARRGPAFCYVNPANPREASFRAARLWFPYSLIGGGGLLALGGFIFLVRTFLPSRRLRGLSAPERQRLFFRRLLASAGVGLMALGVHLMNEQHLVDAIEGVLMRSQLIQVPARVEATGITEERGSGRRSHMTYHRVHLVYSYEQAGRRWFSNRWYFDAPKVDGGSKAEAQALVRAHPVGRELTAWIHPQKPWLATLETGFQWHHVWLLLPLSVLLASFWMVWAGLRRPGTEGT
ncbi:MAG TPA: hypothetical protein DDZ88_29955 [Verrucomicrobiales bacterium]|nr:hypothetical protein [Verrucomicrobiales bacterium]